MTDRHEAAASAPTSSTAVNGTQLRSNAQGLSEISYARRNLTVFLVFSKPHLVLDGRRSFPSGHSSSAFVGLGFISLLLLLKLNSHTEASRGGLIQSKFGRLVLILSPLAVALWIAVTRVEDFVRSSSYPLPHHRS